MRRWSKCDLPAQVLYLGGPQRVRRPGLHRHQQPQRRAQRAGVGNLASSSPGFRVANTKPTDSASRRRPTNAKTCAEARSSHCWSSTTQTSGCSPGYLRQQAQHGQADQEALRSGPAPRPNEVRSASRCGTGS